MSDSNSGLKIAVLISGGGTTLRNLLEKRDAGTLNIDPRLVISSAADAGGLRYAAEGNIPSQILETKAYADDAAYSEAIFSACREAEVDLVVMGGFLKFVLIPDDFVNRVVNIHPSLIPAFCGKGFYGLRVHTAVLDYGAKVSGCTIHFVDNEYDHGPIILQRPVPVQSGDTPKDLAARIFDAECEAYPEAIQLIADNRLVIEGRQISVRN